MNYIKVLELPLKNEELGSNKFVITSNHVNDVTHIFHKYPAKFIPHIPRWGIRYENENELLIIDPFCGSGTTNLESFVLGYASVGFDIDPLALLISKVKTTPISEDLLNTAEETILGAIDRYSSLEKTFIYPDIPNFDHWFIQDSKDKISFLKNIIVSNFEGDIKDFLIITLSSIVRETSNADNQSQKTYVSHTLDKTPPEVFSFFKKRLGLYKDRLLELGRIVGSNSDLRPVFITADARELSPKNLEKFDKNKRRVVITSPPYIKAIDYIYNQMLEYFWFGDVLGIEGKAKMNEYKRKYIGTKQIYANEYQKFEFVPFGIKDLDEVINSIGTKSKEHAYITYQYFDSMKKNIKAVASILRKKEHYMLVVGNTAVSGVEVPTDVFLGELAEQVGFNLLGDFAYKIRNRYMRFDRKGRGGIVEDDNVLILERK